MLVTQLHLSNLS